MNGGTLLTPDDARKALETVIRSHSFNVHVLSQILDAWRDLDHLERIRVGDYAPKLAEFLTAAEAKR